MVSSCGQITNLAQFIYGTLIVYCCGKLVVSQLPGAPDVLSLLWLGSCSIQCQDQEATEVSYVEVRYFILDYVMFLLLRNLRTDISIVFFILNGDEIRHCIAFLILK